MDDKTKHSIAMWSADLIGGVLGGAIVTMWISVVIYYGFDAGSLLCR